MASKFAQAFAAKAKARFKESRKAKAKQGGQYGPAAVPNGVYTAIVSSKCDILTKAGGKIPAGTPVVRLVCTIDEGDYAGKEPTKAYFCTGAKPREYQGEPMPTAEDELCGDLKVLMPDLEIEKMTDPAELAEAAETILNERQPRVKIGVRNRDKDGKSYQDVFFNELLEAETADAEEESGEEGDEEGTEEEGEEEVAEEDDIEGELDPDSEEEEEGEEEEAEAPAKGDEVQYKPKGAKTTRKFEVTSVNQRQETVTIVDEKGKKFSNVPWSDLS